MEPLAAYIPIDRRQALAQGADLPEQTSGAALFADISGFTPLTERLVHELGPMRGADELTRQLNAVFGALIAEVHRYRGSVIGFSGDAITCWFDGDDGRRATRCGLAMQQVMTQFNTVQTPAGGLVSMAMKAAIAAGPVRRFRVGDPQIQYIDVLTGPTLNRTIRAEHYAAEGELLLDAQVVDQLCDKVEVAEWRHDRLTTQRGVAVVTRLVDEVEATPWPRFDQESTLSEGQIRPWLLPPIYKRLRSGQDRFLAEIRRAIALFLRFSGLNYDDDAAVGLKLNRYVQWVQRVLARYEGSLIQLTTGDKGSYLYATFGAPIAHEDDAHRAVAAAFELRSPPPEIDFISQVQIGLSRGWMHTGAYGSLTRRTYGVIGDEANVAARLMSLAQPNQILIAGRIAAAVGPTYHLRNLGPTTLKGKQKAIPVYEVVRKHQAASPSAAPRQKTVMIGRAAEQAILLKKVEALVSQAAGGVVIIEGEAGIGKSRLALELVSSAQAQGLTVLSGAGRSIERQTPYRAWQDIFTTYFDLDRAAKPSTDAEQTQTIHQDRVRNLVQALIPDQASRLPLLNDVLDLELPDSELTATLDPALRQQSLTSFLVTLLRVWADERPLVLVIEDAHWLDSLSWDLVRQVARSLTVLDVPLLLVVVTRPLHKKSVEARYLAALQSSAAPTTISLTSLSTYETIVLATARLGLPADALPLPIVNLVRQRAGGNPFFAEELILALRDQGLIKIIPNDEDTSKQRCVISGDLDQADKILPDTIQGLILARIDRLPPKHQLILKVAAVIGRTFGYTPLHHTLKHHTRTNDAALKIQLDALTTFDLTALETPLPELTYVFKHIIIQNVAYQTLVFAQRRQLHRTVAEWYEYTSGFKGGQLKTRHSSASVYPLLVYHYHQAEDQTRERYYARLAGEQAASQFANDEAVSYLNRALDLSPETEYIERYVLLLAREKVYNLQGKREAQQQTLSMLETLAETLDDDDKRAEVALRYSGYAEATSDYPAAIRAARRAISLARSAEKGRLKAEGYLSWGHALWRMGHYNAAQTQLEQAIVLAKDIPHLEARSLRTQGLVAWHQGNYTEAKTYFEQTLAICRQINDWQGEGLALNNLGIIASQQGNYAEAKIHFNQSLLICRQTGDKQAEANVLNNLGIVTGYQGDYPGAKNYYERALLIKREIDDRQGEGMVLDNLGDVSRYEGDYSEAKAHFERSLIIRRETGERLGEGNVLNNLGNIAHYQGDYSRAKQYYEQSLRIRREIGDRQGESEGLSYLGLLFHHLDRHDVARHYSQQALSIAQELGDHRLQGYALTHLGHAFWGLNDLNEAKKAYRHALDIRRDAGEASRAMEPLAGLALIALCEDDIHTAQAHVEVILAHLQDHTLAGAEEPFRVYLSCYRVLEANEDPRAQTILDQTYTLLQARAAKLTDEASQQSFLENVAAHREIMITWRHRK